MGIGFTNDPTERSSSPQGTALLERNTVSMESNDPENFAHYADKERILEATVYGTPVMAICGKVWVPSKSPDGAPVCPTCQEIYESLLPGDSGGRNS